jgi:hypothetical protein
MPQHLYIFPAPWIRDARSIPDVIKGSREWIEKFIPLDEFNDLFGGYVTWRSRQFATDDMPGEGLGVWGKRNVSRFRRILSERGAEFEIINGEGPQQSLLVRS